MPPRTSAIFIGGEPRYFGKYLAKVEGYDDGEDLKIRRLSVIVPEIDPDIALPWALPHDATKRDWLPVRGDIVWVEFQGGFSDRPIWTGLAVAKSDVSTEFLAKYAPEFRRDTDPNGNWIDWSDDKGSPTGAGNNAIRINGDKRLATEDLLAYIKTDILDWLQANLTAVGGWLAGHTHVDPISGLLPVDPVASLPALLVLDTALLASIATYETDRAAGGPNLTNKFRGE